MATRNDTGTVVRTVRLAALVAAGLFLTNIAAALLFERDPALGLDELLVAVIGVSLALIVEFGVFRRRSGEPG